MGVLDGFYEKVKANNYNTPPLEKEEDNKVKGVLDGLYDAYKKGAFKEPEKTFSDNHPILGGVINNAAQNGVVQGLSNIGHDMSNFIQGAINGIPQFAEGLKQDAIRTGTQLKDSPSSAKYIIPSVAKGVSEGIYNIAQGAASLPEAISASYNARPFNPDNTFKFTPLPQSADMIAKGLSEKGVISPEAYLKYRQARANTRQGMANIPLASTIGEFLPAAIPVGRAAGLIGRTTTTPLSRTAGLIANTTNKTALQNVANATSNIAKAGLAGAGYGLVATPSDLSERAQAMGAGLTSGALLGAGGLALGGAMRKAAPIVNRELNNINRKTSEAINKTRQKTDEIINEARQRINPDNYTTLIDGNTGKVSREYKLDIDKIRRIYQSQRDKNHSNFIMGENSPLRYSAPEKRRVQYAPVIRKSTDLTPTQKTSIVPPSSDLQAVNVQNKYFNSEDIVKDVESGKIYEVMQNENGLKYLRDVDDDTVLEYNTENLENYTPDENELIQTGEFKYNPRLHSAANFENYLFSKDDVVEAYNSYIKKPTAKNKEKYQDTWGKYREEYLKKEPQFKENNVLSKLAPKTMQRQAAKNQQKQILNEIKDLKTEVTKREYTTRRYKGAYWKQDVSHYLTIKLNEADTEINSIIDEIRKNPVASISESKINEFETRLERKAYFEDDEITQNYFNRFYAAIEKAQEYADIENNQINKGGVNNARRTSEETRPETEDERSQNAGRSISSVGRSNEFGLVSERGGRGERGRLEEASAEKTSPKNQYELNKSIENYINNKEYEKQEITEDVKNWLKKYTGAGGLEKQGAEGKGLLSEYYTPSPIVRKMWDIVSKHTDTNGKKVLEPSVGIGRFLEYAPENIKVDGVELNPVSSKIAEILYPDANIKNGEFQERFIDKKTNSPIKNVKGEYDIVIGNPPYGQYSGRYKGMGEGKNIARIETYFIKRGLDSLKENGILAYVIPSSFLDGIKTKIKQEIGNNAELIEAYRLPENSFDTTSIGTDIVVLRKKKGASNSLINDGEWFKKYPEKILGTVETRKNRFGKEEKYVKGDIDTIYNKLEETYPNRSKKSDKTTVIAEAHGIQTSNNHKRGEVGGSTPTQNNQHPEFKTPNAKAKQKEEKIQTKGNIQYEEYKPERIISDNELQLFNDTQVDGTLPKNKYSPNEKVNMYKGDLYNDFNYLQGDIYEKLQELEKENIPEKQKEMQRKKLERVLPKQKTVKEILFNPTSDFIRELTIGTKEVTDYDWKTRTEKKRIKDTTLDERYLDYIDSLSSAERNNVSMYDIRQYINGNKMRIDYRYSSYSLSDAEKKAERNIQKTEFMTKLKNTVDKTFNDFIQNELTQDEKKTLQEAWNKKFNAVYNPDYKKMPVLVKGLNSDFNGKKLELTNIQKEGISFLTNKGVGLLGFEVGTGKTLAGIIATVQNMQMGRSKKPLIIVPNQVKDNWIKEINSAFPNIKVNDVGNMSKFKGEIEDNSLTVATYEALSNIWYGKNSAEALINKIYEVSGNFNKETTKRGREKAKEHAGELVGLAEGGNKKLFNIQDLGFDHITVDEAHNFKNLFADAKADGQDGNPYVNITGGSTSTRAARMFLLAQHILNENGNRNVFMLTATPFNNSPLEVFNMLSFLAKDKLDKMGLYNVYQFMENYADVNSDWIVNSRNDVEFKQVVTGFKNASSLREIIKDSMLIRTAEDAGLKRPEKITKRVTLEPSKLQEELIRKAEEEAVSGKKDEGAVLKAINQSRKATLSPDIATNNINVSPKDFVKNSPKINYVLNAVKSMKEKDPSTSQLIYMPLGVEYLPKIKKYLVDEGVFKADEVEIISSKISDDKITKITDSFNDQNGKVKLIIGTNKIKEGMNLNKNSSVLYVPYIDWNPTDFLQIVGRIWRRGNRYSKIRVVVPLLKNSSDSFMFQKLSEKTDRINILMDENKEYIDTQELNTAEEKISMISNPDKKAKMFVRVEEQKLRAKITSLKGRLETANTYKSRIDSEERTVEYSQNNLDAYKERLAKLDPEKDKFDYEYTKEKVDNFKKELSQHKASYKRLKEKTERLELDFNGKDSPDIIEAQIKKVEETIKNLENLQKKKLEEYKTQYEKELKTGKTIEDYIKEFEKETDELYLNSFEELEMPFISDIKKKFDNFKEFHNSVKKGKSVGELLETENIFKLFKDELKGLEDYIIADMPDYMRKNSTFGTHFGKNKTIFLNMKAIGNDIETFTRTLFHEIEHAKQEKEYNEIIKKKNKTREDLQKIADYNNCKTVNKKKNEYYNKHKEVLTQIINELGGLSKEQKQEYVDNLRPLQKRIFFEYLNLFNKYHQDKHETEARKAGDNATGKIYKRAGLGSNRQSYRGYQEWSMGTGPRGSSSEYGKEISKNDEGIRGRRESFEEYEELDLDFNPNKSKSARNVNIDDIDEILPKIKPKDNIIERTIRPISSRLEEISPTLKHALRRFEFDSMGAENKSASIIKPFIDKVSKMNKKDWAKYDLALKNGYKDVIDTINKKYKIENEYKAVRNLLDNIREEALRAGLDVGYIEDYFPRKVIDPSRLLNEYLKSSYIKKLLKEIDPDNILSDEEKISKINSALRGHNGAINANSSFAKTRRINEITKELNRYYKDSKNALIDYIEGMNRAIQTRKFFGKYSPKENEPNARGIESSIGAYVRELSEKGIIGAEDEARLKEILTARFNAKGPGKIVSRFKNIGYLTTMGNPLSAVTQLGDLAFSLYNGGFINTMFGLNKSVSKNKISRDDINVSKIAQEFETDSKTAKVLNNTFKLVGLENIDRFGKEVFINTSFIKLKKSAIDVLNNPKSKKATEFYNYMHKIFNNGAYQVIKDIADENITEDVKYLLFSELSDVQPISLAEMPETYLTSGNGRILYMLRTYNLKLLDVYRREVFNQIRKNPKEGISNLIRLSFYTLLLGATADTIKDFLMGREINLDETLLDNVFKLAMFSKYQADKSQKEGPVRTVLTGLLPPSGVFDDLFKDVLKPADSPMKFKTLRNIPVAGKLLYWWFGAGSDYKKREFKTARKKEFMKAYQTGNKESIQNIQNKLKEKGYSEKQIYKIYKDSKNDYLKPYREKYKNALKSGKKNKVKDVTEELKKRNIPTVDRKQIYQKALKDYYKERLGGKIGA